MSFTPSALLVLAIATVCSADCTYHISPLCQHPAEQADQDDHVKCPNTQCLTLAEVVNNSSGFHLTNATLLLLPGDHTLVEQTPTFCDIDNLILRSSSNVSNSTARILCTNSSLFFLNVNNLQVDSIEFVSCGLALSSTSVTIRQSAFKGGCAQRGGAIALYGSYASFIGPNTFAHNRASIAGGALFSDGSVLSFSGNTSFEDNLSGATGGGGIVITNSNATFNGATIFIRNSVSDQVECNGSRPDDFSSTLDPDEVYGGGAILLLNGNLSMEGESTFIDNTVGVSLQPGVLHTGGGGAVHIFSSTAAFTGLTVIYGSIATGHGGGVYADISNLFLSGGINFTHNDAGVEMSGGGIYINGSCATFSGKSVIMNNAANRGNGIHMYSYNDVTFTGTCLFSNKNRAENGGAVYVYVNNHVTFDGENRFEKNSANQAGGMYIWKNNSIAFHGHTSFVRNFAVRGGALRVSQYDNITFNGVTLFSHNSASLKGGALDLDQFIYVFFNGSNTFSSNEAGSGGAINTLDENVLIFEGNHNFSYNSAHVGGAINSRIGSLYRMSGRTSFIYNSASNGGGVYMAVHGTLNMSGTIVFSENFAFSLGGGMLIRDGSKASLEGYIEVEGNIANHGGGIYLDRGEVLLSGTGRLTDNNIAFQRGYGGAIHALSSTVRFSGADWIIGNNTAQFGAGIALTGHEGKHLYFHAKTTLHFINNVARSQGGAMYVEANPFSYCSFENKTQTRVSCFVQHAVEDCHPVSPSPSSEIDFAGINLRFENNHADEMGSVLHGGSLYSCHYCTDRDHYIDGISAFRSLANNSIKSSDITSEPFRVYSCDNNGPNKTLHASVYREVYPMQTISLSVAAVGQMNSKSPAVIYAKPSAGITLNSDHTFQAVTSECTPLNYTIFGDSKLVDVGSLKLYANEPCSLSGIPFTLKVKLLQCPAGFALKADECQCDARLKGFEIQCDIQDQTFLRTGDSWMGLEDLQLVLHPHCPFDHCKVGHVRFSLNTSDLQCANRRSGTLCGSCQSGLSIVIGSSRCLPCSNVYLSLLVPFALAGVLLVTLLFTLQITMSTGTISGLVFYANILAIHERIFIPPNERNVLTVFIAWLNLDLGIETCFFDGLDAYSKAWLEFVFPLYIWLLVGLVTVLAKVSDTVTKLLGRTNPVSVLTTLFLLSYTKLLRTIMEAASFTTLEYPHNETRTVWLYDGTVAFLSGKHIYLFLFSLLVFVFFFLPYSLVLFFGQWIQGRLQAKWISHRNRLRLKAFLDAHHAPYRDNHRYWVGLLLILRFLALLVSVIIDIRHSQDPHTNLVVLLVIVSGLQMWAWIVRGVYNKWYLDVLEASFIFNLLVLIGGTYQISLSDSNHDQGALVNSSVAVAFATFLVILFFFVWKIKQVQSIRNFVMTRATTWSRDKSTDRTTEDQEPDTTIPEPETTITSYLPGRYRELSSSLREPLLDTVTVYDPTY